MFGAADSLCGEAGLGALAVVVDGGASDRWVVTGVDVVADCTVTPGGSIS